MYNLERKRVLVQYRKNFGKRRMEQKRGQQNTFIPVFPFPPLQRGKKNFFKPTLRRSQFLHALPRTKVARGIQQAPRQVQAQSQTLHREGLQKQRIRLCWCEAGRAAGGGNVVGCSP
ncbi:hypothetical protein HKD37_11G030996 [Glycine soja]